MLYSYCHFLSFLEKKRGGLPVKVEKKLVSFLALFLFGQLSFFFTITVAEAMCARVKKESPQYYLETSQDCLVVIKCFSPVCPSCKEMEKIFQEVSDNLASKQCQFFSVNIDQNDDFINTFKIKSIPTILILQNGDIKERLTGPQTVELLKAKILSYQQ
jgi:thioredoxin 1